MKAKSEVASPQEQLAYQAAEFRRGLSARFGQALSAEDVEDIVQTALITKAPTTNDGRSARQRGVWFARVVHNAAIDYLRARDGRNRAGRGPRQLSLDLIGEIYDGEAETAVAALRVDEDGFDPDRLDRQFDSDSIQTLARRALQQLSPDDRRMITMRYRDGLSNARLAAAVGLTVKGLEKRWARAWVAFVTAASGDEVAGEVCGRLRDAIAARDLGSTPPEATARWEAHLHECPACRVWAHVGGQATGAIPTLPVGGLISGVLGKLGLGGLLERGHAASEHIAAAVGATGGGAGAGVLGAIGGKAAATCITALVCAGGAAFVAAPVVERAVDPPTKEHRDQVASKATHAKAVGASGAPRQASTATIGSAPAVAAPASQVARKATRTQAPVQTTTSKRTLDSARVRREKAQAKQVRATGSPFTPEANDPTTATATAAATASSAPAPATPPPAPADSSHFSGEFSP